MSVSKFFVASLVFWSTLLISCDIASAHPLDLAYLKAEVRPPTRELAIDLDFNARIFHSPESILYASIENIELKNKGSVCPWTQSRIEKSDSAQTRVTAVAQCREELSNQLSLHFIFMQHMAKTFQILGKVNLSGSESGESSFLVEKNAESVMISTHGKKQHDLLSFIQMGMEHIGATPNQWIEQGKLHLPDGVDHILFLMALILGGGGLLNLLKTATGFTLGHSLTLALATLGFIQFPSRWVESAIALSIVFVAVEAFLRKGARSRWRVAMAFGLVHGFGFATALQNLSLTKGKMLEALVGFNVGVEFGQLAILFATVPFFIWIERKYRYSRFVFQTLSAGIAVIGIYWFIVRAFLSAA